MRAAQSRGLGDIRYGLTEDQRRAYDESGYVGPLTLCDPLEMAGIFSMLKRTVLIDGRGLWMRHLDNRALLDLCCRPELVGSCVIDPRPGSGGMAMPVPDQSPAR